MVMTDGQYRERTGIDDHAAFGRAPAYEVQVDSLFEADVDASRRGKATSRLNIMAFQSGKSRRSISTKACGAGKKRLGHLSTGVEMKPGAKRTVAPAKKPASGYSARANQAHVAKKPGKSASSSLSRLK